MRNAAGSADWCTAGLRRRQHPRYRRSRESSTATGIDGNQADNSAKFSGAVYVFTRAADSWSQQAYVKASNTDAWTTSANLPIGCSLGVPYHPIASGCLASAWRSVHMSQRRTNKGDLSKAIAYLRVSTDRQELGLDVQAAEISKWAASRDVELVASFADEAVSGGTALADRPGLQAALKALREHKAGILVAHKRDRFARDSELMTQLEKIVLRKGASIRTADGASDGAGFAGAVQRESMDFVAKLERLAIRDRTSAGLRRKMEKGEAPGGNPPYGWRIVKSLDPADERGWRRTLEEDPREQEGLRLIIELDSQGLSWAEIARRVAAAGYQPRGAEWHPRTVQRLFQRFRNVPRPGGRPD